MRTFRISKVRPHHLELAARLVVLLAHCRAIEARNERDQVPSACGSRAAVDLDQVVDARERVEEEVRLDLRPASRPSSPRPPGAGGSPDSATSCASGRFRLGLHAARVGDLDRGRQQDEEEGELRQ